MEKIFTDFLHFCIKKTTGNAGGSKKL